MKKLAPWLFLFLLLVGLLTGTVHTIGFGDLWFQYDRPSHPKQYYPANYNYTPSYSYTPSYGYPSEYFNSYGISGGAAAAGNQAGCWYVSDC